MMAWHFATMKTMLKAGRLPTANKDRESKALSSSVTTDEHNALRRMFEVSYWGRHWVTQEAIISKTVELLYGQSRLSWILIDHFFAYYLHSASWHFPVPRALCKLRHDYVSKDFYPENFNSSAFSLVQWTKCHDLRDKVYGLQGLLPSKYRIPVDYTLSDLHVFLMAIEKWDPQGKIQGGNMSYFTRIGELAWAMKIPTNPNHNFAYIEIEAEEGGFKTSDGEDYDLQSNCYVPLEPEQLRRFVMRYIVDIGQWNTMHPSRRVEIGYNALEEYVSKNYKQTRRGVWSPR